MVSNYRVTSEFNLDVFLEELAEEQLFKSISPKYQAIEATHKNEMETFLKKSLVELKQERKGERPNPVVPEFIEEPASRAGKNPVDEKGYPFVSQSDAARILEIDRKQISVLCSNGLLSEERERVSSSAGSRERIWIRITDLQSYLRTRNASKAEKIERCLRQVDEFRALALQNGFKLRTLESDYDVPEFYRNLIKR